MHPETSHSPDRLPRCGVDRYPSILQNPHCLIVRIDRSQNRLLSDRCFYQYRCIFLVDRRGSNKVRKIHPAPSGVVQNQGVWELNFVKPIFASPVVSQNAQGVDTLHRVIKNRKGVYPLKLLNVSSLSKKTERYGFAALCTHLFCEVQHLFRSPDPLAKYFYHLRPDLISEMLSIFMLGTDSLAIHILVDIEFFHQVKYGIVELRMVDDLNELHSLLSFFGKD